MLLHTSGNSENVWVDNNIIRIKLKMINEQSIGTRRNLDFPVTISCLGVKNRSYKHNKMYVCVVCIGTCVYVHVCMLCGWMCDLCVGGCTCPSSSNAITTTAAP